MWGGEPQNKNPTKKLRIKKGYVAIKLKPGSVFFPAFCHCSYYCDLWLFKTDTIMRRKQILTPFLALHVVSAVIYGTKIAQ